MGGKSLWRATGVKSCSKCAIEKPLEDFKFNSKGIPGWCYECTRVYTRDYQRENRTPEIERERRLKAVYNLTAEEFTYMVIAQGGKCGVCKKQNDNLYVDHNHITGQVRGLLCQKCNSGIGFLGDTVEGLSAALDYLNNTESKES